MTVIMNCPPASKKAMPLGLAPYIENLLPSARVDTWETRAQVPKSCSLSDLCWPAALPTNKDIPNAAVADIPMFLRQCIGDPPLRIPTLVSSCPPFLIIFRARPSAVGKVTTLDLTPERQARSHRHVSFGYSPLAWAPRI